MLICSWILLCMYCETLVQRFRSKHSAPVNWQSDTKARLRGLWIFLWDHLWVECFGDNNEPLVVTSVNDVPAEKNRCSHCGNEFPRGILSIIPYDIVLSHRERWEYLNRHRKGPNVSHTWRSILTCIFMAWYFLGYYFPAVIPTIFTPFSISISIWLYVVLCEVVNFLELLKLEMSAFSTPTKTRTNRPRSIYSEKDSDEHEVEASRYKQEENRCERVGNCSFVMLFHSIY